MADLAGIIGTQVSSGVDATTPGRLSCALPNSAYGNLQF